MSERGELLTASGRAWLAAQPLPAVAREQITIALAVIDALDAQLTPLYTKLRAFARRQPGGRALRGQFGVRELNAITILAELEHLVGHVQTHRLPGWPGLGPDVDAVAVCIGCGAAVCPDHAHVTRYWLTRTAVITGR